MAQTYTDIPATQTLKNSRQPLLDRDNAAASNFSGTAFPTTNLLVGMRCHRTDLNKVYVLKDLTPTWIEVEDVTGTSGLAPRATVLANSRNFSVSGDVATAASVAFNGSGDVALNVSLAAQSGLSAGSYTKVTVNTKGIVTAGGSLTNSDLPANISVTTLRLTSTSDVSLASTNHAFQIGATATENLVMDSNEIQVRNNSVASLLALNAAGGNITLGASGATVSVPGTLNPTAISLPTDSVSASAIAANAVTTAKIQDAAITSAKFATGAVEGVIAAAAAGAVGTLAFLARTSAGGATLVAGTTYAASQLSYAGMADNGTSNLRTGVALTSGTWRALGTANQSNTGYTNATLCVRIA